MIDAPIPSFYLDLLEAFPNAKVILTVREPNSWLKSFRSHYNKFADVSAHASACKHACVRARHNSKASVEVWLDVFFK